MTMPKILDTGGVPDAPVVKVGITGPRLKSMSTKMGPGIHLCELGAVPLAVTDTSDFFRALTMCVGGLLFRKPTRERGPN